MPSGFWSNDTEIGLLVEQLHQASHAFVRTLEPTEETYLIAFCGKQADLVGEFPNIRIPAEIMKHLPKLIRVVEEPPTQCETTALYVMCGQTTTCLSVTTRKSGAAFFLARPQGS